MTGSVIAMSIIGIVLIIVSFFVSEKLTKKEEDFNINLLTVDDNYEFSDRELRIIKRKIEDVIVKQAKDILYETNESLASMANEKTMALGDYAVTVCDEIEKNHKEVMFLYSMLDDKQKEIMETVKAVDSVKHEIQDTFLKIEEQKKKVVEAKEMPPKQTAIDQLTALRQLKENTNWNNETIKENTGLAQKEKEEPKNNFIEDDNIGKKEEHKQSENQNIVEKEEESTVEEIEDLNEVFEKIDQLEIDFNEVLEEERMESENSNDIILELHKNGESIIEIAKQLGIGVGEVKLVIDLYQGE